MKINDVQKQTIEAAAKERSEAENLFREKNQALINILFATSGQQGFNGYEIKEDELIMRFPKEPFKEKVKKLRKAS